MSIKENTAVRVLIGGDVSTHYSKDWRLTDAEYSRTLFRELRKDLDAADFRLCNLENVICEAELEDPIIKSGPNLRGEPEEIGFLTEGGFDCVFLANNHLGDHGPLPVLDTIRRLDEVGIGHCGGGKDIDEAYAAWYAEKNGVKIAFISVCENEFGCAREDFPGSAGYNEMRVRTRIVEEKKKADFVVIIFHGGQEMNPVAGPSHIDRYRLFTVYGADAVVAMHTHCIQGTEVFEGKPIIYSMGNFYFNGYHREKGAYAEDAPWHYGYMTELFFEKGKPVTFRLIPYHLVDEGRLLHVFEGEEKEKMLAYIDKLSALIQDPKETQRFYDAWCTKSGLMYLRAKPKYYEQYVKDPSDANNRKMNAILRNIHTCEAHNEMLRRTSQLMYLGKIGEAAESYAELQELQKMPV